VIHLSGEQINFPRAGNTQYQFFCVAFFAMRNPPFWSNFMKQYVSRYLLLILIIFLVIKSCLGFQKISLGTGTLLGGYSIKWGAVFLFYIAVCVLLVVLSIAALWKSERLQPTLEKMIAFRERLGFFRWLFALLVFISPIWFLQYTQWGLVFRDIFIRIVIWCLTVFWLAFFIKKGNILLGWTELLVAILLTSSGFMIAVAFINVANYPFSMGWSEGNRMWDYSIMFGRSLYNYPTDKPIYALIDVGRQFVGGLPFLIPGLSIEMERSWISLTVVIPYLLLGLAAFRSTRKNLKIWFITTLWVLIFLKQGPIHPPLILCAVATVLLWQSPLWLALPFIAITGYVADASRYTWAFAPGIWIGMLELAGAALHDKKLNVNSWIRAISLGLVGVAGGMYGSKIAGLLTGNSNVSTATPLETGTSMVSSPTQLLLWYRLLPNETYSIGVLAGLLIATLPLIIILFYLVLAKKWTPNFWQSLALIVPLLAFLIVGLVISTKIGGGGDLHNLDMFLIGLVFTTVIAWQKGGGEWLTTEHNIEISPVWVKFVLVLLLALPGIQYLPQMRSFSPVENISALLTLTDTLNEKSLDLRASRELTDDALRTIRKEIALAQSQNGPVLFMDQRQLLTFGYIKNVPFIPEYEKKMLMEQSLNSNAEYFQDFYNDLANHRFALIISDPLRKPIKDSSFQFGEENNAWVKWVSNPVLCYYDQKITLKEVGVQLLVPKSEPVDCSAQLP
jgi:hypothetical protein